MHLSRRLFCGCLATGASLAATASARAQSTECAVITTDRQKAMTPDESIARLKAGNERFTAGKSINCDLMAQVRQTADREAPRAAIVGCIDSRVPPELVFDQRIGDVFCARVAGNFVNNDIIGSLEFATALEGAKAIVILGHSNCGAIKGAVDHAKLGHLTAMLRNFDPAMKAAGKVEGPQNSSNKYLVQKVADANATLTAASLVKRSPVVKGLVDKGQLKIVAAMHDLITGKVAWMD
jgi:carbonic anhydrase